MKTIHLIRHAKSSWENSRLSDVNRPLSPRGMNDCNLMAPNIFEAGWNPVNIYCSKARRAQLTIKGITDNLPQRNISWLIDDELYTFNHNNLIHWIESLEDDINEVTVVGHNPAMTELINHVSNGDLNNFPTCAYAQLFSTTHAWKTVFSQQLYLEKFIKPKMFKK